MTTSVLLFTGVAVIGMAALTKRFVKDEEKARDISLIVTAMGVGILIANLIVQLVG